MGKYGDEQLKKSCIDELIRYSIHLQAYSTRLANRAFHLLSFYATVEKSAIDSLSQAEV
jgi:hypothetical protein